jgi:hypothetical protein
MRNDFPTMIALSGIAILGLAGCDDDTVTYIEDGPPAVPTGVYTITGDGWVDVRWNPVYEDDVAGYGVYRTLDPDDAYARLATISDPEASEYRDYGVVNGVTYYYAVDAFDHGNHESDLSYEDAFDTPRPAGIGVTVHAADFRPLESAIDFSDFQIPNSFVTAAAAPDADIVFELVGDYLYARGTFISGFANDIQDLGYTESMDDVSWAPGDGWSASPIGVELIAGHTYAVWTWDDYYAKFRVHSIRAGGGVHQYATIDWAYQIDRSNPELSQLAKRDREEAPEGRGS